jgi:hypothetical protein
MPNPRTRRLLVGFAILLIIILTVLVYALSFWFDAGNKHDTSSDLITATITAQHVRVFDVSAVESQVDFLTEVQGLTIEGTFPVQGGTISLEPVGDALRVHVYLEINVDDVKIAEIAKPFIRHAMATGDYPIAFYVATSRALVPVTEEVITFVLDGELEVHNVAQPHSMDVEAQLVGEDMWAIATSDLDLGQHDIEFPSVFGSSTIQLTAKLFMHENETLSEIPTPVNPK